MHVSLPDEKSSDLLKDALEIISADAKVKGERADVLLLGRYKRSKPKNMAELDRKHPDLRIDFKTVHRSKGLEADYVVVLGLCSGKYGFPTEITDDPILDIVLAAPEGHPNAEERRLFYVALTRARRQVFLLADGGQPSPFVRELIEEGYDVAVFGRPPERDFSCPKCIEGRLERKSGKHGTFYGCSNWPYCDHTQSACSHCGTRLPSKAEENFKCLGCGQSIEGCPSCDGWLQPRNGRHGWFLGCTNFPDCRQVQDLPQATQQAAQSN